ncbi:MAG: (Fe-S)-binding protein [Ketobacter sp.]|nr:MAG: (Fe-S)-binding protein [Ketobacter sp.]
MKTWLDWSAYKDAGMGDAYADIPKHGGDYAKAIAACINSRQCEAEGKQVMCPSYRVSGNPHLSTGGRVRLLKAALSGDPNTNPLMNPELREAMDLCVSCKGCKRECESNVDMPLIKVEYLAQRRLQEGLSLRSRLFAQVPIWLYRAPWLRHFIQWRNQSSVVSQIAQKLLGLNAKARLPVPSAEPYPNSKLRDDTRLDSTQSVLLFVDTFTRYFEPQIAAAATAVLSGAGYLVEQITTEASERPLCCGRTYLAQGMIDEARAEAKRMLDVLLPHLQAGATVVGLEASCVLGLRDDAQALGLGDDAKLMGKQVLLLEEFLARESKSGRFELKITPPQQPTLVHGHCHQKATGAMKSMRRILKSIPQHDFDFIESSCCGMAGTFGLEAEHQEYSEKMVNQGLLSAIEEHAEHTLVANGFSCRQQIFNYSGKRPLHLAELLAKHLD